VLRRRKVHCSSGLLSGMCCEVWSLLASLRLSQQHVAVTTWHTSHRAVWQLVIGMLVCWERLLGRVWQCTGLRGLRVQGVVGWGLVRVSWHLLEA
jgi:hypothetical protein